jgi:enoyl-CoA hydratase/carnithine racemase
MSDVIVERSHGIQTVRIHRPAKKNALTRAMYDTMTAAMSEADTSPDVAVHVILGSGGVFTAGNDIQDFANRAVDLTRTASGASSLITTLPVLEKPIIAGVDGLAIGIGVTMLFHCDLVYASPTASFRTPFLDLGLIMEAGSSLLAPQLMGHQRAFELLCLGEPFTADQAVQAGIVNRVVPAGDLEATVMKSAARLAAKPPGALAAARRLMRKGRPDEILARITEENSVFAERLKSAEAKEAFAAFLEKRPPDFAKLKGKS